MQKQDWLMAWFGQGKVLTKQLKHNLKHLKHLAARWRAQIKLQKSHCDRQGLLLGHRGTGLHWSISGRPPAARYHQRMRWLGRYRHHGISFQPWHCILQHAKWFKKAWHEAVTSLSSLSCQVAEALDRENDLSTRPNLSTLPDFGSPSALMLGADWSIRMGRFVFLVVYDTKSLAPGIFLFR